MSLRDGGKEEKIKASEVEKEGRKEGRRPRRRVTLVYLRLLRADQERRAS